MVDDDKHSYIECPICKACNRHERWCVYVQDPLDDDFDRYSDPLERDFP